MCEIAALTGTRHHGTLAMPGPDYYRKQAQLFTQLARATRDPAVVARCNGMALEYLVKAGELDPDGNPEIGAPPALPGDRSAVDRN